MPNVLVVTSTTSRATDDVTVTPRPRTRPVEGREHNVRVGEQRPGVRSFVDPTHELLVTVEVSAEVARVARSRPDNVETGHREQLRRDRRRRRS